MILRFGAAQVLRPGLEAAPAQSMPSEECMCDAVHGPAGIVTLHIGTCHATLLKTHFLRASKATSGHN